MTKLGSLGCCCSWSKRHVAGLQPPSHRGPLLARDLVRHPYPSPWHWFLGKVPLNGRWWIARRCGRSPPTGVASPSNPLSASFQGGCGRQPPPAVGEGSRTAGMGCPLGRPGQTARAVHLLRVDPTQSSETGTVRGLRWHSLPREKKGEQGGRDRARPGERGHEGVGGRWASPPADGEGSRKGQG